VSGSSTLSKAQACQHNGIIVLVRISTTLEERQIADCASLLSPASTHHSQLSPCLRDTPTCQLWLTVRQLVAWGLPGVLGVKQHRELAWQSSGYLHLIITNLPRFHGSYISSFAIVFLLLLSSNHLSSYFGLFLVACIKASPLSLYTVYPLMSSPPPKTDSWKHKFKILEVQCAVSKEIGPK